MKKILATPHGELRLPAFFPDATRGVVRSLDSHDLEDCGVQGLMVNVFHLTLRPGTKTIASLEGMHRFMNWRRPLAIDSGGFQIYSLIKHNPDLGSVTPKGFVYRRDKGGKKQVLTPEKCIRNQFQMGGDILFCLDYCTHPDAPGEVQEESVKLTVEWARKCRKEFDSLLAQKRVPPDRRPLLFAVVQGGEDSSLRRRCAEDLLEIGFDGYGYGGWPIVENQRLSDSVGEVARLIPSEFPRFALGIGKPENLVRAFSLGYDLFDCVIPTRDARHMRLYVFNETSGQGVLSGEDFYRCVYMQDESMRRESMPVEECCDCLCCRHYSRAYVHHLFRTGDSLASRLATIHNLRFYRRLIDRIGSRADGGESE